MRPIHDVGAETCQVCKGSGVIEISEGEAIRSGHPEIENDKLTCTYCNGTGEIQEQKEEDAHRC